MLNTTDVLVYIHPVIRYILLEGFLIIPCIGITQEIPGRINKGIHGISFALSRSATLRTGCLHKGLRGSNRRNSTTIEFHIFRKTYWQLVFWHQLFTTLVTIDNRNRGTPIPLARNEPVSKAEVFSSLANPHILKFSCYSFTSFF